MSRLTQQQVRERFLDHVLNMVDYWSSLNGTDKDRLLEMAFSILTAIDGGAMALPKFVLAPDPHPDDREHLSLLGEDWYPENHGVNVAGDIAGELHSRLLQKAKER